MNIPKLKAENGPITYDSPTTHKKKIKSSNLLKTISPALEWPINFEYFEGQDNTEFTIHQGYEEPGSTITLRCKTCKSDELKVGVGDYFTAIKCIKCGHEECIHEG